MTEPIPGPKGWPLIGNLLDIRHEEGSLMALESLADIYGPVTKINLAGRTHILIASADLLLQFTDETQFTKIRPPGLNNKGAQGLFTAAGDDPDWGQAHRILAPAFGPLNVDTMFDGMKDIAFQLCMKWARTDEGRVVSLTDDFTRLTLDTIALCTMDYRFNSFYSTDHMHPFVDAMLDVLSSSGVYNSRPAIVNKVIGGAEREKIQSGARIMSEIAQSIINKRKNEPTDRQDMLNVMLYGKDPKTGQTMRDELIGAEMVTFLIAGHETTSGALSYLFFELMQNPKIYLAARQEVDRIIGKGAIQSHHLKDLKYLNGALRETLRLHPTAPVITKSIPAHRRDEYITICDGKYHLENDWSCRLLLGKCMRDPSYFGEDANQFNPMRMHEDNSDFSKHMKAFKSFGNGSRSCIGQNFAWHEAILVAALVLQNFDVNFEDPGYKLKNKQTLTVKPDNLNVRVKLRKGLDATTLEQRLHSDQHAGATDEAPTPTSDATMKDTYGKADLRILYGTNQGTCQALAQRLASAASRSGLKSTVADLDSAVDDLDPSQNVIIVTPSYEGQPPENAARFVSWLETSSSTNLEGLRYAVFGCGHRDWQQTFHRIPNLIDMKLKENGAIQIIETGLTDVADGTVIDDFTQWQKNLLRHLSGEDQSPSYMKADDIAEISMDQRAQQLSNGLGLGTIKDVKVLTGSGQPEKRHMEIELPKNFSYEVGDYLAVLPMNPDKLVHQIMKHWNISRDATITLKSQIFSSVPVGVPISVHELLKGSFELSHTVSRSNIEEAKTFTKDADTLNELEQLLNDKTAFHKLVNDEHTSMFGLLSKYKQIQMPFASFLTTLLPLCVRQYSISSTPLAGKSTCTITYSVVKHSTATHIDDIEHEGVASTFLSTLSVGDKISIAVKRTATANAQCPFRLPPASVQATTPLMMFCAGTGLAPFRAFVQQRAMMLEENRDLKLAPALLFVGCRSSTADRLYADELEQWQKLGAVDVRYAFSQEADHPLAAGCKYVSDRMMWDIDDVRDLWKREARVYFCGSRRVQQNIRERLNEFLHDIRKAAGMSEEEIKKAEKETTQQFAQRAVSDIFD